MQLSAGSIGASKWFVPTWMAQLQLSKPTLLHGFLDRFWAHILVLGSKLFSWPRANKISDEVSYKSCAYSNHNFTNQVSIAMWLAEFSVINNISVEKYKDVSSALVNLSRLGVIILDGIDPRHALTIINFKTAIFSRCQLTFIWSRLKFTHNHLVCTIRTLINPIINNGIVGCKFWFQSMVWQFQIRELGDSITVEPILVGMKASNPNAMRVQEDLVEILLLIYRALLCGQVFASFKICYL